MFALVDANAFYCAAEQVFRPDWRNKPIVVLSNNDGCIVAANQQAKALGIPKFIPFFQIKELCQEKGVIALSSNYELYSDLSAKMMQIIGRFAPEQFIYSIDECFLSFNSASKAIPDLHQHGLQIRQRVWKETKLAVCVGIAPTLTLAKVANHAAKKIPSYRGVCLLDKPLERNAILTGMAANDVWGVGTKMANRLAKLGIHTAYDLANMPPVIAKKHFTINLERTIRELNGLACLAFNKVKSDKKQIYSTRSMGQRIYDFSQLQQALCNHTAIAAKKARSQGSLCKLMTIFAASSPHDMTPASFHTHIQFHSPTNSTLTMNQAVAAASHKLYKNAVAYYKIGVGLLELIDEENSQLELFDPNIENPNLMKIFDNINQRYGPDSLFSAAQGINPKWGMKRDRLTKQYTSRWQDLPLIKC